MMWYLYNIILVELVVGGGGRVFAFGPATLRIYLFLFALSSWIVVAARRGGMTYSEQSAVKYVSIFVLVLTVAFVVGLVVGNDSESILLDFRQLIYLLLFPFFASQLVSPKKVHQSVVVIFYSGFVVAIGCVALFLLLRLGVVDFYSFYILTKESGELIWRGEDFFFYKGVAYVGVAIVLGISIRPKYWLPICLVLSICVLLTLTRGMIFSVVFSVLFVLLVQKNFRVGGVLLFVFGIMYLVFGEYVADISVGLFENRGESSAVRFRDLYYFIDNLGAVGLLLGKGLGTEIAGRLIIEQTYMWLLWKFGVMGLLVAVWPLYLNFKWFKAVGLKSSTSPIALGLFSVVFYMYLMSVFNPFMTNSIGISCLIICSLGLRGLARVHNS